MDRLGWAGHIGAEYKPSGPTAESFGWLAALREHFGSLPGRMPPDRSAAPIAGGPRARVLDFDRPEVQLALGFRIPSDRREAAALEVFLIPARVQFFHQHDGYFGVTGDDNLFVKMQNGIRVGLATGFVTTLRHDLDYDRSPAPGRRNTDLTLSLTLGYRF